MLDLKTINNSWTLFLDRDGVINHEKHEDYILHKDEFRFYEQVTAALTILNKIFGVIVMVTNQKGVGRGLMTEDALHEIHDLMLDTIRNAEGRIDKVYYCAELDNDHPTENQMQAWHCKRKKIFRRSIFKDLSWWETSSAI
jgi:D-glycero-D-manno-heptose 1,7-bisphosphate phosphatase